MVVIRGSGRDCIRASSARPTRSSTCCRPPDPEPSPRARTALPWGPRRRPARGSCIANAYTDNHAELEKGEVGAGRWFFLHMVDTVGFVHAMILRIQAMLLPVQTLVLSGH